MSAVRSSLRLLRLVGVLVVGGLLLLIGLVMIVTPGPAFLLIPAGLAILGLEFGWARGLLARVRRWLSERQSRRRASRADNRRV